MEHVAGPVSGHSWRTALLSAPELVVGRDSELASLTALTDAVAEHGSARVVLGEAGIGKTTVLRRVADHARAAGLVVLTVSGIETEAGLPFAGLHQLLSPVLDLAARLPANQRRALLTAFEIEDGPVPEPFLVALASLGLLSEAAGVRPLLVAVDDAHWLDGPTHDALAFVARRIEREALVLIATVRSGHDVPLLRADVPTTVLSRLDDVAAAAVVDGHGADLTPAQRTRLLEQAQGNPLALVELPAQWSTMRGPDGPATFVPLSARLERAFASRLDELPQLTRDVLLIAALDDEDDLSEILATATRLAGNPVDIDALEPAAAVGLLAYDIRRVAFRHPLVRSGILQREPLSRRRVAHAALAEVLVDQPFRSTWHRAQTVVGRDDEVADALEDSCAIALRRGSPVAAIWALEEAAKLTSDGARRGRRLLLAAEHAFGLGRADLVDTLVTAAAREPLAELDHARMEWLREIFNDGVPGDAERVHELCEIALRSARAGDVDLSLSLLLGAALRCWWADAGAAARAAVVSTADEAVVDAAGRCDPRFVAILAVAEPVASATRVHAMLSELVLERENDAGALRLYAMAAHAIGAAPLMLDFSSRAEAQLRDDGRLALLSHVLTMQILDRIEVGDWDGAAACVEEGTLLARDTNQPIWDAGTLSLRAVLTALRGEHDTALAVAAHAEQLANGRRLTNLLACVQLARGLAAAAVGRYAEAYAELRRMFDPRDVAFHLTERYHALSELAAAALRCGELADARQVVADLERETAGNPAEILRVHLAYARAVLARDEDAEQHFQAALSQDLQRWPWARARLELGYGGWLRRQRRVADSRRHLRSAQMNFELIGAAAWAEQARAELRAAGERSEETGEAARELLSAQELHIARLAANGLSNRQIGERLFLSPRTVGSHLYRIFPKLGVTSRSQLAARLQLR